MIIVDPRLCCACASCVSVCPVDALNLAETRLIVGDECIDCGTCLAACPVGALSPEHSSPRLSSDGAAPASPDLLAGARASLAPRYDLVVAGAGPAGSTAAWQAARLGLSVLLLEKRQEIGSPVRCAEGVAHEPLAAFLEPDTAWIAARVTRARIVARAGGREVQC